MKRILFFTVLLMVQLGFGQTWTGATNTDWNTPTNWNTGVVPISSGVVIIPNVTNKPIISVAGAVCASLTINNASGTTNTLTINTSGTLAVSGSITISAPSVNNGLSVIDVVSGTLSGASITLSNTSGSTRDCRLTIGAGTVTVLGSVTMSGAVDENEILFSGAGTLNVGNTITGAGTFTRGTGTVNYNNGGAQTVGTYTYNNLTLSGSGTKTFAVTTVTNNLTLSGTATATTGANLAVGGALTVGTGASLTTGNNFTLTVTGTTGVTGTLALGGTGNKRFDGLVTINTGGSWINNIANSPINFRGGIANTGTFTAGTGIQTFDTSAQAISGTITMSNVAVTGITLTNNGNFYVQSNLSGTGAIINAFPLTNTFVIQGTSSIATITNNGTTNLEGPGAKTSTTFTNSGTVNLSGSGAITSLNNATAGSVLNITAALPTITTLTATTSGNNVNYNGANQTVIGTTYSNLTLSNSGPKTFAATTTINNNLSIASGVVANLGDGLVHTARNLILGGTTATFGSWGSTVSAAANKTDAYFSSTGLLNVSAGTCVNNLISNGDFANGATGWTNATTQGTYVEINSENTYFSSSNGNNTAELDSEASLRQTVTVIPGVSYTVSFRYARRPNTNTPATTGVTVSVIGGTPFTSPNLTSTSSVPQVGTFTFTPTSATISLEFYNTIHSNSTHGTIIDDIVLIPSSQVTPFATTTPPGVFNTSTYCAGVTIQLDVNNVPASGVTYAWTGSPGAVFSSTSIKNPTIVFTGSGIQQATVTVATSGGCLSSATTYVNVRAAPTITTVATPAVVTEVCQSASVQNATMPYTATTNAPTSYSINWDTLADQGSTAFTFLAGSGNLNTIIVPANTPAGTYTGTMTIVSANGCTGTKTVTLTVGKVPSVASSSPVLCINTALIPITHTTINATGIGTPTGLPTGVSASWVSNTITISGTPTASGTFNYTIPLTGTCSGTVNATGTITVNPLPSAPTVGTITNVTCSSTTGSVVLSGLQNGWIITQSGTALGSYTSSGTSYTVTGLAVGNYTFSVNNGTCTSASTPNVPIADASSTTWNGSSWSNGTPDATKNIIIASSLGSPFAADLTGCALTINTGVTAIVPSGVTLTITNSVITNGQLIFENNASLVQTTNATNIGAIEYRRISSPMKNFDFTYWSSPVTGQNIVDLSPNTLADKYFRFSGSANDWVFYNGIMVPGVGYIIRTPKPGIYGAPYPETVVMPYSQPVAFKGVPNNGNYPFAVGPNELNLIGNPYPSAIRADDFINANSAIINGALYFWTHNTVITNNTYTADDYASYTLAGGTGTSKAPSTGLGGTVPDGFIAAGQSFFVENSIAGSFQFTNAMRVAGNNSQFFKQVNTKKTATVEKNRVWLNLTNSKGAFKQLLVGYITGATNDWDNLYDGPTFDGQEFVDFYSTNQGKNLTIQGRALPFETTDVVPLGYRSTIPGAFDISIDKRDGALASQEIWLEDKKTNTLHELTKGKYTFTAINGVENDRFVLKYTNKTLGTDDNEVVDKSLIVSVKNKKITLTSSAEAITQVQVFDLLGRKVYDKSKINAQEWSISNLSSSEQTLIVKTTLANGAISNKKIIY